MADKEQKSSELDAEAVQEILDNIAEGEIVDGESESAAAEGAEAEAEAAELSSDDVIEQLQDELGRAKEDTLRALAEAQNSKRRAEQDVEKARKFALEQFAKDLLPVVDNMERALEAAGDDESSKPVVEGVELTLKSFFDALKKFKIEAVDPNGEPFDPQFHQAMGMVPNPDVEPNTVIAVMQKGYTLNGRLVRPAMVMVSKAADA